MIEIGHYALTLALGTAVAQIALSVHAVVAKDLRSLDLSVRSAIIGFCLVSVSLVVLMVGFLNNDFSVHYIANNANAYLPWYYKISAVWSGHEGSLLLWVWILFLWILLLSRKSHALPPPFRAKVFMTLGVIGAGFIAFVLLTSNPFTRLLPTMPIGGFPLVGKDLNPLLQDIGLILHPPLLYMGYVGFAVCFAFIVAALWEGRLDAVWARWARPWTTSAWGFLTIGIALGSWWAYYELDWGGWWFWDPVENASLMPWLAGTALIHSLAATSKRDVFKVWTAFLAISAFSLSLIGTFLVRSGVLTSVHAFASDPTRGLFILILLGSICGTAFLLLIVRAHTLRSFGEFHWVSREMGVLINNVVLSTACVIVFIGTLTPLLYDVLGWEKISIGAAYFNAKMLWILILALVFLTFAPYLRWKRDRLPRLWRPTFLASVAALCLSYLLNRQFDNMQWQAVILLALTFTALFTALFDAYLHSHRQRGGWEFPSKGYLAMVTAHIGFLACCTGIILAASYSSKKDVYITQQGSTTLGALTFTRQGSQYQTTPLYDSVSIDFAVKENGKLLTTLSPEKRHYHISQMPMAEAAILPSLTRDIYIALGEPQENDAWSVRIQTKPYIRWVWLGALIMACSAIFVVMDRRKTNQRKTS